MTGHEPGPRRSGAGARRAAAPGHAAGIGTAIRAFPARTRQYVRYLTFLRPHRAIFGIGLVCTTLVGLITVVQPLLARLTIDVAFPRRDLHLFVQILLVGAGAIAITAALRFLEGALGLRLEQRVGFDLRRAFYAGLHGLSVGDVRARSAGDLLYRSNADVDNVRQMILGSLPNLLLAVTKLVVLLAVTLWIHWRLTLLSLAGFPFIYASTLFFSEKLRYLRDQGQQAGSRSIAFTEESLVGFPLLHAFGRAGEAVRRYAGLMAALARVHVTSGYVQLIAALVTGIISAVWSLAIAAYSGYLVIEGEISVGEIVAIGMLLYQLHDPFQRLGDIYSRVSIGLVSADRLEDVVGRMDARRRPGLSAPAGRATDALRGEVAVDGLVFGYLPGQRVLDRVSLRLDPGDNLALVGPPGAGKSTLLFLLAGFLEPLEGEIRLDGRPLPAWPRAAYRSRLAMVQQQPVIFGGTVGDNVALGLPLGVSRRELGPRARDLGLERLLARFGLTLDTPVGESGKTLSGGQQQVVALARALIRQPTVLLLDEPTSFLDAATERMVTDLLRETRAGRTAVTIAHRLATLEGATKVVVLEGGRVVEAGTHDALRDAGGYYSRMIAVQPRAWAEVRPEGFPRPSRTR